MLPAIPKVVNVIDDGLAGFEHVAQTHLARLHTRLGSPVLINGQAIPLLADCELPQVVIEPAHDDLDDVVQDLERDRGRNLDLTPDQRIGVPQLDTNGGDLVEAVGCGALLARIRHAASLAGRVFPFQGSSARVAFRSSGALRVSSCTWSWRRAS